MKAVISLWDDKCGCGGWVVVIVVIGDLSAYTGRTIGMGGYYGVFVVILYHYYGYCGV